MKLRFFFNVGPLNTGDGHNRIKIVVLIASLKLFHYLKTIKKNNKILFKNYHIYFKKISNTFERGWGSTGGDSCGIFDGQKKTWIQNKKKLLNNISANIMIKTFLFFQT